AYGVTGKIEFEELPRAFSAQIGERRPLHDSELPLFEIAVGRASLLFEKVISRPVRPFGCALESGIRFVARRRRLDTFVEHHRNVRAERKLNLRGFFWSEKVFRAVNMRTKAHAFIGNLTQFRQAKNLIAARIRENRAVPRHEFVQTSGAAN